MSQKTMYAAVNNSPRTSLSAAITATETTIPLRSVSGIPLAPNLITIGNDDDAEVVKYNGISNLNLTGCERGFEGTTAKIWLVDSPVYRAYTKYDHDTFKDNIEDLDENKLDKTGGAENATVAFTSAAQRVNLSSGEKIGVSFGKIAKFFADLKALAFLDTVGTSYITNGSVTNAKLDNMSAKTLKGNAGVGTAPPTDLTPAEARTIINVADGADVSTDTLEAAPTSDTLDNADKLHFIDVSGGSGERLKSVLFSTIISKVRAALFGSVSGIAKVDGSGNVTAAESGTDYQAPLSYPIPLSNGGTGASTSKAALDNLLPAGGAEGNFLKKTAEGYAWGAVEGGGGMLPIIHVTAEAGTLVAVTKGETVISGVTGDDGKYTFEIPERGVWAVSDGNRSFSVNVDHCTDYECNFLYTIMGVSRSTLASAVEWARTDAAVGLKVTASIGTSAGSSDFDEMPIYKDIERVTLSTGDVMVKIPKFWYKRYVDSSNVEYIKIADKAVDGFALHPAFLRNGVTHDFIYVGAYKTTTGHTSKAGLAPYVNITRAAYRNGARGKGSGWGIIDIAAVSAIQMLILVEFATNDVQTAIGAGWSNGSAAKNTGTCDSVPNLTGRPAGTSNAVDVVWRGIEGFWGNVWEWTDGLNWNNGIYYVSNNPAVYADDTSTGYEALDYQGSTGWSSSYITAHGLDADHPWAMLPSAAGSGSASTYYADGCWSSTGWRVFKRGGSWHNGTLDGLFAAALDIASSATYSDYGSRLLYLAP